jgi:hypothetical protein
LDADKKIIAKQLSAEQIGELLKNLEGDELGSAKDVKEKSSGPGKKKEASAPSRKEKAKLDEKAE